MLRRPAFTALIALLLSTAGFAPSARGETVVCPDAWEQRVAVLINEERALVEAPPVSVDVRLVASARLHSEDMALHHFMGHDGSDGSAFWERIQAAGYPSPGGETVGAGHSSPEMIVDGWMNSPPHRAILLDARYTHVGIGYAPSDWFYPHLWTANFGSSSEPPLAPEVMCPFQRACGDGIDNDGDGLVDYPEDPGCRTHRQLSEADPNCGLGFEMALLLPVLGGLRRPPRRTASA